MYRVHYLETGTDEATDNTVRNLNANQGAEDDILLSEVIENCKDLGVKAELFDATGFRKGTVKADGSYKLS